MKKRGRPKGSKNKSSYLTRTARTQAGNLKSNSVMCGGSASNVDILNTSDALLSQNDSFPSLDDSGGNVTESPTTPNTAISGVNNPPVLSSGWTEEECAGLTQLAGLVAASLTSFQGFTYSDDESRLIGTPLSKVLNKYFPDAAGKTDELSLAVVLLAITSPKINAYIQEQRNKSESTENKSG